jgi:uncharacterized membrane protein YraQ (UPF0718 family)
MIIPTITMAAIALVLFIISYRKGVHIDGIGHSVALAARIFPLLVFAFIVAGLVQVLIPHETLMKWVGEGSGLKGIFIGTIVGAFAPGGPYTSLPIAAALMRSGAGIGTMVAFLTGWSLWAFARLPIDVGILGWRFAVIRFLSVFFFPPIAGLIAQYVSKFIK